MGRAAKLLEILAGDAPASADTHTRAEELSNPKQKPRPPQSPCRLRAALLNMEEPGGSVEGTQREVRLPRRRSRVRHQKRRPGESGQCCQALQEGVLPRSPGPSRCTFRPDGKQGTQMKETLAAPSQDSACSFPSSVSFLRCICLFIHSFEG